MVACSCNSRSGGEEWEVAWGLVAIQYNQICELQVHWKTFSRKQDGDWGRHLPSASLLHVCTCSTPALSAQRPHTYPLYIQKKMDKINKSTQQHYKIKTHGFMSSLGQLHNIRKHVITVIPTCNHYSTLLGSGHMPSHSVPTAALWAWPLKTKWSSACPTCHRLSVPRSPYRFYSLAPHMIIIRPRAGETLRQDAWEMVTGGEPSTQWTRAGV